MKKRKFINPVVYNAITTNCSIQTSHKISKHEEKKEEIFQLKLSLVEYVLETRNIVRHTYFCITDFKKMEEEETQKVIEVFKSELTRLEEVKILKKILDSEDIALIKIFLDLRPRYYINEISIPDDDGGASHSLFRKILLHFKGMAKELKVFIETYGVDVNRQNDIGTTAFMSICCLNDNWILDFFIKETNANIKIKDNMGADALSYAIIHGNLYAVQELMKIGLTPDFNFSTKDKKVPKSYLLHNVNDIISSCNIPEIRIILMGIIKQNIEEYSKDTRDNIALGIIKRDDVKKFSDEIRFFLVNGFDSRDKRIDTTKISSFDLFKAGRRCNVESIIYNAVINAEILSQVRESLKILCLSRSNLNEYQDIINIMQDIVYEVFYESNKERRYKILEGEISFAEILQDIDKIQNAKVRDALDPIFIEQNIINIVEDYIPKYDGYLTSHLKERLQQHKISFKDLIPSKVVKNNIKF